MESVKKQLRLIQQELEHQYEPLNELIDRLKQEGKSMNEIEQEVVKMGLIQMVYDSVETTIRILES